MTTLISRALPVVVGLFSLPLAAWVLDGPDVEDWVFPGQVLLAIVLGGVLGLLLPGISAAGAGRRFVLGAALGLAGAAAGTLVLFALLAGIDPA